MKNKLSLLRLLIGAGFCFLAVAVFAQNYDPPVRVIAVADVLQLSYRDYSIREFVDVYNDDFNQTLVVTSIVADTYHGRKLIRTRENWQDNWEEISIPPGKVRRIAERKRIVSGKPKRNWWIRWVKFTIDTNRGQLTSNSISSPFKGPIRSDYSLGQDKIDTLSEPGQLTPNQKK